MPHDKRLGPLDFSVKRRAQFRHSARVLVDSFLEVGNGRRVVLDREGHRALSADAACSAYTPLASPQPRLDPCMNIRGRDSGCRTGAQLGEPALSLRGPCRVDVGL